MVRIENKAGLTNVWRIGQTFPINPENVAKLNLDGPELEHVQTYTPYGSENLEGLPAFFVAAFLTFSRGLPIQKEDECPPTPKKMSKRT